MKVFTYFEQDHKLTDFKPVLDSWCENWLAYGFDPVILGFADALKHPLYDEFTAHVESLPTVNPKTYEMSCWQRWLAMDGKVGLHVDSDVVVCDKFETDFYRTTILDQYGVPCAVWVDEDVSIPSLIMRFDTVLTHNGRPHTSDQTFFQLSGIPRVPLVKTAGHDGWQSAPLIHLATDALAEMGLTKAHYKKALTEVLKRKQA